MTDDTTPGDLTGTVREVQAELRDRYDASEVEIRAEEFTDWDRQPGGRELLTRERPLRLVLQWDRGDIPTEGPETPPVVQHLQHVADQAARIQSDFPDAEVSTFVDQEHGRINLDLED